MGCLERVCFCSPNIERDSTFLLVGLAFAYKKRNKYVWWCPVLVLSGLGIIPMVMGLVGGGTGVIVVLGAAFSFLVMYTYTLYGDTYVHGLPNLSNRGGELCYPSYHPEPSY